MREHILCQKKFLLSIATRRKKGAQVHSTKSIRIESSNVRSFRRKKEQNVFSLFISQHRIDENRILKRQVFSRCDCQIQFKDGFFEARYARIVSRILLVQKKNTSQRRVFEARHARIVNRIRSVPPLHTVRVAGFGFRVMVKALGSFWQFVDLDFRPERDPVYLIYIRRPPQYTYYTTHTHTYTYLQV